MENASKRFVLPCRLSRLASRSGSAGRVPRQAAALARKRRFELAAWQVYECAKNWREADASRGGDRFPRILRRRDEAIGAPRTHNSGEDNAYSTNRARHGRHRPLELPLAILTA